MVLLLHCLRVRLMICSIDIQLNSDLFLNNQNNRNKKLVHSLNFKWAYSDWMQIDLLHSSHCSHRSHHNSQIKPQIHSHSYILLLTGRDKLRGVNHADWSEVSICNGKEQDINEDEPVWVEQPVRSGVWGCCVEDRENKYESNCPYSCLP